MEQIKSDDEDETLNPKKDWVCKVCTFINSSSNHVCNMCGADKLKEEQHYKTLLDLDVTDLIENMGACAICTSDNNLNKSISLNKSIHHCEQCLAQLKHFCDSAKLEYPFKENYNSYFNQPRSHSASANTMGKLSVSKENEEYKSLLNLDDDALVGNIDTFDCLICMCEINPGEGVILHECLHQFCKDCLASLIEHCDEAQVKCPFKDDNYSCNIALLDREIKALVTDERYKKYLTKSVAQAEYTSDKSYHCKTPDCNYWCIIEGDVNEFECSGCRKINCLTCRAVHTGINCREYQESINWKPSKEVIDDMVAKGEALFCSKCNVVIMKIMGCDWLQCSMCKTEICWATKGPRWGPLGKGDTTGGCKCGVNGVKCHPRCQNCH